MLGIAELDKTIDSLYSLQNKSNISFTKKMLLKSKRKSLTENFNSKINDSLNYKG
jgi:hypothetical protein